MSNSAINTQVAQLKVGNVQNQADSSGVYSAGAWDFKNASAVTSVKIDNSGNVGIGKSPTYRLDIQGAIGENATLAGFFSGTNTTRGFTIGLSAGGGAVNDGYVVYNHTLGGGNSGHIWQAGGTERMRIDASGNLAIAGTASTGKITVTQNTQSTYQSGLSFYFSATSYWNIVNGASSRLYFGFANGVGGYTDKAYVEPSTGAWTPVSDERAKKNIETISYGLNDILQLNPVKYNMNEEDENTQKHLGFIAQEVKQVIAEAVTIPEDEERLLGLDKTTLIPVLVKAIQELSAKVDAQAAEIEALKAKP